MEPALCDVEESSLFEENITSIDEQNTQQWKDEIGSVIDTITSVPPYARAIIISSLLVILLSHASDNPYYDNTDYFLNGNPVADVIDYGLEQTAGIAEQEERSPEVEIRDYMVSYDVDPDTGESIPNLIPITPPEAAKLVIPIKLPRKGGGIASCSGFTMDAGGQANVNKDRMLIGTDLNPFYIAAHCANNEKNWSNYRNGTLSIAGHPGAVDLVNIGGDLAIFSAITTYEPELIDTTDMSIAYGIDQEGLYSLIEQMGPSTQIFKTGFPAGAQHLGDEMQLHAVRVTTQLRPSSLTNPDYPGWLVFDRFMDDGDTEHFSDVKAESGGMVYLVNKYGDTIIIGASSKVEYDKKTGITTDYLVTPITKPDENEIAALNSGPYSPYWERSE